MPIHYKELRRKGISKFQDPRTWDMRVFDQETGGWSVKQGREVRELPRRTAAFDSRLIPRLPLTSPNRFKPICFEPSGDSDLQLKSCKGITDTIKQRLLRSLSGFHPAG